MRLKLLRWYGSAARDLPWRRTRDPYAIWVSEVMLQQTRVDTVIPFYERFLEHYPTPADLAQAPEDAVMALWSGLGYYRRARLLHAGAREVLAKYGGFVPRDPDERRSLPGIGRYTAGAIGSIAFEQEEPIVDGNVARVLSRIHCVESPLGKAETEKLLWTHASTLVRGPRPGDLNQALMELGATVCTPSSPSCESCPVSRSCGAHRTGRTADLPVPRARKAPTPSNLVAVLPTFGRPPRIWLTRGAGSLFGGLWGLPMSEGLDLEDARRTLMQMGLSASLRADSVDSFTHVLSHRRLSVRLFRATAARGTETEHLRRLLPSELSTVGISSLTRNLLRSCGIEPG